MEVRSKNKTRRRGWIPARLGKNYIRENFVVKIEVSAEAMHNQLCRGPVLQCFAFFWNLNSPYGLLHLFESVLFLIRIFPKRAVSTSKC